MPSRARASRTRSTPLQLALLALLALFGGPASAQGALGPPLVPGENPKPPMGFAPGNMLIVVADDLGVEELACYGVGLDYPATPTIDQLAAGGVRFEHCWSNPMCSPTRATLQTGRFGLRTGIGFLVTPQNQPLPLAETTLPEMLDLGTHAHWSHALVGKWHLGNASAGGSWHPNLSGWSHFAGALDNFKFPFHYDSWPRTVNGQTTLCTVYATTQQVDDALDWVRSVPEPWLLVLSFNAPHLPFHAPPDELHGQELQGLSAHDFPRPFYKAMVEALDAELGRFLTSLDPGVLSRTNTFFLADNGTPAAAVPPPFDPAHAKLSMYEGGVRVPLIVSGPVVKQPGRVVDSLVHTVDLFSTVAQLAGVHAPAVLPEGTVLDSISLVPHLEAAPFAPLARVLYTDRFQPNGPGPYSTDARAVSDGRWKLIVDSQKPKPELYDLLDDPFETQNLYPALHTPAAELAYADLTRFLEQLLP